MKKAIGIVMVATPFVGITAWAWHMGGAEIVALGFGITASIAALIIGGLHLLNPAE